jgi:tRNA(Ile)-lysidine synthase
LVKPGDRILVAISGGADSIALLYVLYSLADEWGLLLRIAHLNHLIQPDRSFRDALFVQKTARDLNLPFTIASMDSLSYHKEKRLSLQAGARELRYRFFVQTAQHMKFNKVALGHTADDQAETILMRLIRGGGLKGLSGIPPIRKNDSISYIRPLIETTRQEIEDFITQKNIAYITDPSNLKPVYFRNKIRLELLPNIKKGYNPNIVNSLVRLAEVLRDEERFLEDVSQQLLPELILEKSPVSIILDKGRLIKQHPVIQRRLLRQIIKEFQGEGYGIPAHHTFGLLGLINRDNPEPATFHLPGRLMVESYKNRVIVRWKNKSPFLPLAEKELKVSGCTHFPDYGLTFSTTIKNRASIKLEEAKENRFMALLDYHKLNLPLKIRTRGIGDRFCPLGMHGSKKLKEFFIDHKVPREERDRIPLVGSETEIVWVVGFEISDKVKITAVTTTALEIRVLKSEKGQ